MTDLGKMLAIFGAVIAVVGLLIWAIGRSGFRGLPGDISYEGRNVHVYFPIVTCILVSIILSFIFWLIARHR